MPPENPGRGELTKLMTDKIFRDVHGNPGFAVIHRNSPTDHFRDNGGAPGICFYHFPFPGFTQFQYFFIQTLFDKRAFLDGP
jgi:hypothetical protein